MQSALVSQHNFSMVPKADIPRSSFDRSHTHKTTFDAGYLIPVFWDLAYPGDTFNLNMTAFARMSIPLKAPMDNLYLDSFFFQVPLRLLWDNWKKFNGEQDNPADSTSFTCPQIVMPNNGAGGVVTSTLYDYFGISVGALNAANTGVTINNFLGRAYNQIWNAWFRDSNLQNSVQKDTGDGPDTYANYVLLRRGKRHDYFTSALPWPQKGTAVSIPLGTVAPVISAGTGVPTFGGGTDERSMKFIAADAHVNWDTNPTGTFLAAWNQTRLQADLTNATAATINSLRQAFQLQKLYERDARGGTRYPEILMSHFGVTDPQHDVLQRPVYLGGGSSPVTVSPIVGLNQLGSGATNQGNIGSFATISAHGHGFSKSFTEHCVVLGLVSVRADLTYQQGLDREHSYRTRFDWYWPALSHIGEQTILNKEIYCQGDGVAADAQVFGYQERYAELRYKRSMITGYFRSNLSAGKSTLDYWHLSQNFGSLPTLNTTFIQDTPPVDRVVAVTSAGGAPHFIFDSFFKYICARPLPLYGVPGDIDRF